jgi:hypothetical protein
MLHESVERVLPLNRHQADVYLSDWTFEEIDRILRALDPVTPDLKLSSFTRDFAQREEDRLQENLESFGYEIDDSSTLRLITGEGREERVRFQPLTVRNCKSHGLIIDSSCSRFCIYCFSVMPQL